MTTFEAMREVLVGQFKVEAARAVPEATLESLGLDSLALMEFVFAVEDRFSVRIPEDALDPRQTGTTLARLAELLDAAVAAQGAPGAPGAPAAPAGPDGGPPPAAG